MGNIFEIDSSVRPKVKQHEVLGDLQVQSSSSWLGLRDKTRERVGALFVIRKNLDFILQAVI